MQEHVEGHVSQTGTEIHDVFCVLQFLFACLIFEIRTAVIIIAIFTGTVLAAAFFEQIGQLCRCGVPLYQGLSKHLQTCITELKGESLVDACRRCYQRVRAFDLTVVNGLLQLFALNLEHEGDPALACFEAVEHVFKEWLCESTTLCVDHERVNKYVQEAGHEGDEQCQLAILSQIIARNVPLPNQQLY